MESTRFDTITRVFGSRASRRTALLGGLGLAAAPFATLRAQDATPPSATPVAYPADPLPSADGRRADPEFLFVQPFDAGTWAPNAGADGVYTLTLSGAAAQTAYFSDRPDRIVGLAPTQQFLDGLGFTPDNPPNAALVTQTDAGEQEVLVIELLNPVYDAAAGTLTYEARVLADYAEPGLAHLAQQQTDYELPESFGEGSLFIDDCPDGKASCWVGGNCYGNLTFGLCWTWSGFGCDPCRGATYVNSLCNQNFSGCNGECVANLKGTCGA